MNNKKEPTWKEALRIGHNQTREKLAPMKQVMLEICKEKQRWWKWLEEARKKGDI